MKQPIKVTITVMDAEGNKFEVSHVQSVDHRGEATEASTAVVGRAANDTRGWLRKHAKLTTLPGVAVRTARR